MERVLCVVCVEYKGLGATVMSRHATSSVMQVTRCSTTTGQGYAQNVIQFEKGGHGEILCSVSLHTNKPYTFVTV
jgi:hypothetical protein